MKKTRGWGQRSMLGLGAVCALGCSAKGINELESRPGSVSTGAGGSLAGGAGPVGSGGDATGTGGGSAGAPAAAGRSAGGTGGGSETGGGAGSAGGPALGSPCAEPLQQAAGPLFDFNDGSLQGAGKGVYVFADDTTAPAGVIAPPLATPEMGVKDAGAVAKAFNFTGSEFTASAWGGGVGVWLQCRDASALSGLKFQLKSDVGVRVVVMTAADTAAPDGSCSAGQSCVNAHRVLPASAEFSEQTVDFASLSGGQPSAFDPSQVVGVQFVVEKSGAEADGWGWDVWLDELEFY